MFREFLFALTFATFIFAVCESNYKTDQAFPPVAVEEIYKEEVLPVKKDHSLAVKDQSEIYEEITRARLKRLLKERRAEILPVPTKTQCVSPAIIRSEMAEFVQPPKIKKIKKRVVIAIIDTGIDLMNPFLSNQIYLPMNIKNINELDFSGLNSIQDTNGHGTHVAGIILSVFPSAKILPLKYHNPKSTGEKNLQASINALRYAIDQGVDVINYSNGGPESNEDEFKVIQEARKKGILVISAAGNERGNLDSESGAYYPASYALSNIITVGNIDRDGNKADKSSYGKKSVDLFALGSNVNSYSIYEEENCLFNNSGTSMAVPLVTATVALIKASNPKLNYKQIKEILLKNVEKQNNLLDISSAGGKLNINRAIASTFKTKRNKTKL